MTFAQPVSGSSARPEPRKPTPEQQIDAALVRLAEHARPFARLPIGEKINLLRACSERLFDVAPEIARAGCLAKRLDFRAPAAGDEWLSGPFAILRTLRLLIAALDQVAKHGAPQRALSLRERSNGQLAATVLPHDVYDKLLFGGFRCEAYLGPGLGAADVPKHQASFYRQSAPEGRVALVLGAGNVAAIPAMDVLYEMFVEGKVCLLKMNPVNDYLGSLFERAFADLIERGFLAIVYGGAEVGSYACQHRLVEEVHITGSAETHDHIVWGPPGPERERRKREGDPLLKKPITSELGNVSPVLIVPGPYSERQLATMARNIAGMVTLNASFNCNAAKLLVTPAGWAGRDALLDALRRTLRAVPPRFAYYPGAAERYRAFTQGVPRLEEFGTAKAGELPWALVTDLEPAANPMHFREESFCAVLGETRIGGDDPGEFLQRAVDFVNDEVWGTLNATLFVHPSHERDPVLGPLVEGAIERLRYGAVAVNHWPAMIFAAAGPPWGAFPGATLADVQSGIGFVHNCSMFERLEKAVLRGPLEAFPKPAWFPDNRTVHHTARKLVSFERRPSFANVGSVAFSAVRG